jgi:tellurite resistance protein
MPNSNIHDGSTSFEPEIPAAHPGDREDELLDAVITAAALVARADGWIEPAERRQLLDFLNGKGLLTAATRDEILDLFDCRIRQFEEGAGAALAVDSIGRLVGRPSAQLVIDAGEQIAAADGHLHGRELHMLQLIRAALGPRPRTPHPRIP